MNSEPEPDPALSAVMSERRQLINVTYRAQPRQAPALDVKLAAIDTARYHRIMAMTLRLSDEQTAALRRKAEAEHRSMQQVALAAIDAYIQQATPGRREAVSTAELMEAFQSLPPLHAQQFRDDLEQVADDEAHFDAYERVQHPAEGE